MLRYGHEDVVNPTELHAIPAPGSAPGSSAAHTDTARVVGDPQTVQGVSQVVTLEEVVVLETDLLRSPAWPSA